jgi:hypothetical protein
LPNWPTWHDTSDLQLCKWTRKNKYTPLPFLLRYHLSPLHDLPLPPPQKHAMTARSSWLSRASSLVLLGGAHLDAGTWISLDTESSRAPSLSPVRILWAVEKRSGGWCAHSSWWRICIWRSTCWCWWIGDSRSCWLVEEIHRERSGVPDLSSCLLLLPIGIR